MSYDQWLYRPEPDAGPIDTWTRSRFAALGSVAELKRRLSERFPAICWRGRPERAWSVQGPGAVPPYSIVLSSGDDGQVRVIGLKGASQQEAVALARPFGLCAYDPQKGETLDVQRGVMHYYMRSARFGWLR